MRPALLLVVGLLVAGPASAGILSPGSINPAAPFTPAYWDHPSWDGPGQNVGERHPGLPYLSMSGAPVPFTLTDAFALEATLISETSDYAGLNRFGWFVIGAPTWGEFFAGADGPGASAFTPPSAIAQIGLWFLSPAGFFTSVDDQVQFALFQESPTTYLLGIEDLSLRRTDSDYNDLIVRRRFDEA